MGKLSKLSKLICFAKLTVFDYLSSWQASCPIFTEVCDRFYLQSFLFSAKFTHQSVA